MPTFTSRLTAVSAASFGTGAYTPAGTWTPNSSSLLAVAMMGLTNAAGPPTGLTISGGGWTYTAQGTLRQSSTGGSDYVSFVQWYTAPVTTGAAMQVTFNATQDMYGWGAFACDYTSYDTGTPIGATGGNAAASDPGALSYNLSGTPASTSHVIAAAAGDASTGFAVTEAGGWAMLMENTTILLFHAMDDQTTPDISVEYTDLYTNSLFSYAAAAIEVNHAAAASQRFWNRGTVPTWPVVERSSNW